MSRHERHNSNHDRSNHRSERNASNALESSNDPIISGGQTGSYSYDQQRESSDSSRDQGEHSYGSVTTYYDDSDHVLGSSSGDFHESDDDHNRFSLIGTAPQPF